MGIECCGHTQVDVAETTTADLTANTILVPHAEVLSQRQHVLSPSARRVPVGHASSEVMQVGEGRREWMHTIVVIFRWNLSSEDFAFVSSDPAPLIRRAQYLYRA